MYKHLFCLLQYNIIYVVFLNVMYSLYCIYQKNRLGEKLLLQGIVVPNYFHPSFRRVNPYLFLRVSVWGAPIFFQKLKMFGFSRPIRSERELRVGVATL